MEAIGIAHYRVIERVRIQEDFMFDEDPSRWVWSEWIEIATNLTKEEAIEILRIS
jgi:hypothetical protein